MIDCLLALKKKHTHTHNMRNLDMPKAKVEIAVQPCNGLLLVLEMTGNLIALRAEVDRSVSVKNV